MLDPYKIVYFNIILAVTLLVGIITYKHSYPEKKINLFYLLIIISILPVISIFRPGVYESGDFTVHVYRAMSFYQNLSEANYMPSWAGELNATYGYPLFIFLYTLPYFIVSFFHFLGFSFVTSMKLLLVTSYVFSGVFFYLFVRKELKNTLSAFSGAIFYLFTPYHLVALHFKVTAGELLTFLFLPIYFYSLSSLRNNKKAIWFILSSVSFALMMISHQAMTVFSLPIILAYIIFRYKVSKEPLTYLFIYISTIAFGFIISIYSWLPHVLLAKYTRVQLLYSQQVYFPNFIELIYSPWKYGFLFQGPKGELSYLIGYTQLIILGIAAVLVKTSKKTLSKEILFWLGICICLVFMMTPISLSIWNSLPILNTSQFSIRLLILLVFAISFLASTITLFFKKNIHLVAILLILTIGYTIPNWGTRKVIPEFSDATLLGNLPKSTAEAEGSPPMIQPKTLHNGKWIFKIPKNHIETIGANAKIQEIVKKNEYHSYVTYSNYSFLAKENTLYFPDWKLYIDKKQVPINYSNPKYPGILTFQVPAGLHYIELEYSDPPELKIAKQISSLLIIFTVGLIILFFAYGIFYHKKRLIQFIFFKK